MPLFGKKHNNKNVGDTDYNDTGRAGQADNHIDNHHHADRAAADGVQNGRHRHDAGVTGHGGTGTNARNFDTGPNAGGYAGDGAGAGAGNGAGYGQVGNSNVGTDPYANQGGANVPPANAINQSTGRHGGGGGHGTSGRIEQAVGSMVGSQALQDKGRQKEQEANAYKAQSGEIAEAERLEREAMLRRERAVAHGAHPGNRQLGGVNGAQGVSDGQTGTGVGVNGRY